MDSLVQYTALAVNFFYLNLVCSRCGMHLKMKPLFAEGVSAVQLIPKA